MMRVRTRRKGEIEMIKKYTITRHDGETTKIYIDSNDAEKATATIREFMEDVFEASWFGTKKHNGAFYDCFVSVKDDATYTVKL